jgi:methyltransferase (TIGR00027 family)
MPDTTVTHISDTALWVAAYRARESKRPDAIFRDPLAERLAGERGHQIANDLGHGNRFSWPIIVRTKLIDELVLTSIAEGADRVVNLAAGLDTRPYRLDLPADLTWIEADLPDITSEKERLLQNEKPVCRLLREKVDLADAAARGAMLDRALGGAKRALVITEGLLVYLEPAQVQAIGRDLYARSAIAWWMIDLASPRILAMMKQSFGHQLSDGAQMKFAPADGVAFFRPLGWNAREIRSFFREAVRLRRAPWYMRAFSFLPDGNPERLGNRPWGAIVRFARGQERV